MTAAYNVLNKHYVELGQQLDLHEQEVIRLRNILKQLTEGKLDLKRVKSTDDGVQIMPEEPKSDPPPDAKPPDAKPKPVAAKDGVKVG